MNITDMTILVILFSGIAFAIFKMHKAKKIGKSCCNGCKNCPFSNKCKKFKK